MTVASHARPSRRLPNALLGALLFIVTETVFFVGLVSVTIEIRRTSLSWPPPGSPSLNLALVGANLVLLVLAAAAARGALRALRGGDGSRSVLLLVTTGVLGALFLAGQTVQFGALGGWLPQEGIYRTLYQLLAGLHGLHVLGGLGVTGVAAYRTHVGQIAAERPTLVRANEWYWYFVAGVWVLLLAALLIA